MEIKGDLRKVRGRLEEDLKGKLRWLISAPRPQHGQDSLEIFGNFRDDSGFSRMKGDASGLRAI